mmetsp:Transcript_20416/g.50095  ORF Transcript_20416/g.50095 Transcript_20416/m.50095 type:complete len:168 (+) Transcript_20416:199-702(+)
MSPVFVTKKLQYKNNNDIGLFSQFFHKSYLKNLNEYFIFLIFSFIQYLSEYLIMHTLLKEYFFMSRQFFSGEQNELFFIYSRLSKLMKLEDNLNMLFKFNYSVIKDNISLAQILIIQHYFEFASIFLIYEKKEVTGKKMEEIVNYNLVMHNLPIMVIYFLNLIKYVV